MAIPKFIQIHTLHTYDGVLLNRDDTGSAKRITIGGVPRIRVSSQCLKRHWLTAEDEHSIGNIPGAQGSVRSRNIVERMIAQPLKESGKYHEDVVLAVATAFNIGVYGKNGDTLEGRQPLFLGRPEIEHIRQRAEAICELYPQDAKEANKAAVGLFSEQRGEGRNFRAMANGASIPIGLECALTGRMITSDTAANIDSAISVSQAYTVHAQEVENDYFTTVDDLQNDDEPNAAGMLGNTELSSGIYYGYVVIDLAGLVSNLEGCRASEWEQADRSLAAEVCHNLIQLIAQVSPGAKKGSTAPFARARFIMAESGSKQPYSLDQAFHKAVRPLEEAALEALQREVRVQDLNYGFHGHRQFMALDEGLEISNADRSSVDDLAIWVRNTVLNGHGE